MTQRRHVWRTAGRLVLLGALAVGVGAACARNRPEADPQPAGEERRMPAPIPLTVDSKYREDVTVYVLRGGQRSRLGIVTANTSQGFVIPASIAGDLAGIRLVADPAGGSRAAFVSETVVPQAGQRLVWTLESRLGRSTLGVY